LLLVFVSTWAQVDFKTLDANVSIDFEKRFVSGICEFEFEVKGKVDSIRIDAVSMSFSNLKINKKVGAFKANSKQLVLYKGFKQGKNTVSFQYSAQPTQTMYFVGEGDGLQVWTQGQGKNTSHWLPSFDDANEKLIFNITASFADGFTVLSNGVLKGTEKKNGKTTWRYAMQKPMSSYLVMLAIGKFDRQVLESASGIRQELYYRPEDADKFEPTYRYSTEIFDYLEREIGVDYPWQVYRQVPVRDFLYGGMENTTATIFTQDYVVDAIGFNDRNYVNVNAHELAHQWFGDIITAKHGDHHWLQEGFATYYALLAERAVIGEDHFFWKLYENAREISQASRTDTIPVMNAKASSLTFYKKGAWALHVLRTGVGEDAFRTAVKIYLDKHAFKNVETEDFLSEIRKVSDFDVDLFKRRWLESGEFYVDEAVGLLTHNAMMRSYFDLVELAPMPFDEKRETLLRVLHSDMPEPIKEEAVLQLSDVSWEKKEQLIRDAMATNSIVVRQAVAATIGKMPESFYAEYSKLLEDESYITREIAIRTLINQFPDKRNEILDRTKGMIGLGDRNLRILWLTYALMATDYEKTRKLALYDELLDYTTPKWEASIRQNALRNLMHISPTDTHVLEAVARALVHHKWQLTKYARDTVRSNLKKESVREFYSELLPKLDERTRVELERLLKE
jgi:aminopeptidase N